MLPCPCPLEQELEQEKAELKQRQKELRREHLQLLRDKKDKETKVEELGARAFNVRPACKEALSPMQ